MYFGGPLVVCIGGAFGAALVVLNVSLSHWEPRAVENADVHLPFQCSLQSKDKHKVTQNNSVAISYGHDNLRARMRYLDIRSVGVDIRERIPR